MAELGKKLGKLSLAILENFVEGKLGKKFVEELRAAKTPGSSPRVWGILIARLLAASPTPVHPHVCGEYEAQLAQVHIPGGSSPRVWGIRFEIVPCSTIVRFIPTCVGNTPENGSITGSPVRFIPTCVGNTFDLQKDLSETRRFIPTCVGNTILLEMVRCPTAGSSPRVWGIRRVWTSHIDEATGSSPRVWGIRIAEVAYWNVARFIPTCVGNTTPRIHQQPPKTVHPHVCGEYGVR